MSVRGASVEASKSKTDDQRNTTTMRNTPYLAIIGLMFFGLGFSHGRVAAPLPSPSPSAMPSAIPSPAPSQIPVSQARINVGSISGASPAEVQMIGHGVQLANAMLDKPCFKQWVSAATYTENNGLNSPQIYQKISTEPSTVNVEMYYENNRVVGFEYDPFDGVVHMNRKFVNTADMVADNLEHEDRGHSLGFHHYGRFSSSVPYGMNYAYEGCSQQQMVMAKGGKLIPFKPKGLNIETRHRLPPGHPRAKKKKHAA